MREPIRYPGRAVHPAGLVHPQRRPAAQRGRAGRLPAGAGAVRRRAGRVRREDTTSRVVGGCCGTTPEHLKLLVEKMGKPARSRPGRRSAPRLASAMSATAMRQDPPPILLGERCNAQGSRKFKRLLLAEDYDGILEMAREQVDGGAHALDICVARHRAPRRSGADAQGGQEARAGRGSAAGDRHDRAGRARGRAADCAGALPDQFHAPGKRACQSRPIFGLAKTHNAAVICLTIDENGMAKTAERKLEVARRIYDIAVNEHGLRPEALVFDALTFTLATGDPEFANSAIETIEGIRLIKADPAGRADLAGRQQRFLWPGPAARPVLELASCCITACRPAWIWRSSTRPRSRPTPRSRPRSASWPRT